MWNVSRVVVFGLGFLAVAPALRADDADDRAVKYVEGLGGKVGREENKPGKPVVSVDLQIRKGKITDDGLKELAAFKSLTHLYIPEAEVSGAA